MNKGKKEITEIVERLELLEEKFGIAISGLYATCEFRDYATPSYLVIINFDLASLSGGKLERSFVVYANAYNSAGQLLTMQRPCIDANDFMGLESFSLYLEVDLVPEKIRLYPAR